MNPLNNATPRFSHVLNLAQNSIRKRKQKLYPVHFLLAILELGQGIAHKTLVKNGIDLEDLKNRLEDLLPSEGNKELAVDQRHSVESKRILGCAIEQQHRTEVRYLGTEHLLLAILNCNSRVSRNGSKCKILLKSLGLDFKKADADIKEELVKPPEEILGFLDKSGPILKAKIRFKDSDPGESEIDLSTGTLTVDVNCIKIIEFVAE